MRNRSCGGCLAMAGRAGGDPDSVLGDIRKAMAYRVKYRVKNADGSVKRQMALSLLGVHPMNRGGVYCMDQTVQNLGLSVLVKGINVSEANHDGICVQELPSTEQDKDPSNPEKPYVSYKELNFVKCGATKLLRTCFNSESDTLYGTLSHGHLLLALLAMATGAPWAWTPAWRAIFNSGGPLDMAAVAAKDEGLATLFRMGLTMEVLSWKIYKEEPAACSLISQALNSGHSLALKTSELTALAVLTGTVTLELESAVAGRVSFEGVKEKVRHELDMFVDQPDFMDLFEFVVSMGANKNSFIPQLVEFGSNFVEQKTRQLRLQAFQEANKLPITTPRCKIAMLMRAYRKAPVLGWCPTPEQAWAKSTRQLGREREIMFACVCLRVCVCVCVRNYACV